MDAEVVVAGLLQSDLTVVEEMRRRLQNSARSAYYELTENISRAQGLLECISQSAAEVVDTSLVFPSAVCLATRLRAAHRLLLTVNLLCDGDGTLARLQSLFHAQSLDKALALAANFITVGGAAEANRAKVLAVMAQWEDAQQPGPIVPLTLSLDTWRDRLFPPIPPVVPALLLDDTTKLFSLHIQLLAQQIDRAFISLQTAHRNLGHLSAIWGLEQDELLLDIHAESVEYMLASASTVLLASVRAILDQVLSGASTNGTMGPTATPPDQAADYLQLLVNLTARLLAIIEARAASAESVLQCPAAPFLAPYKEAYTLLLHAYRDIEVKNTPAALGHALHSNQLHQFEDMAALVFRRIQDLEHADPDFLVQLEQTLVQETVSCACSQSLPSLFAEHKLLAFARMYAKDESTKEQLDKRFRVSLDHWAAAYAAEMQPCIRILAQTQDPTLFIEQFGELLTSEDDSDWGYLADLATTVVNHTVLALAAVLVRAPIPASQVSQLKPAFKEVANMLRATLQRPVTAICAPLLSLHGIMTSTSLEEAASYARGTCLEGIYFSLAQAYGLAGTGSTH